MGQLRKRNPGRDINKGDRTPSTTLAVETQKDQVEMWLRRTASAPCLISCASSSIASDGERSLDGPATDDIDVTGVE
jgi:hypothetical protein